LFAIPRQEKADRAPSGLQLEALRRQLAEKDILLADREVGATQLYGKPHRTGWIEQRFRTVVLGAGGGCGIGGSSEARSRRV